jgi:hypothetical protein
VHHSQGANLVFHLTKLFERDRHAGVWSRPDYGHESDFVDHGVQIFVIVPAEIVDEPSFGLFLRVQYSRIGSSILSISSITRILCFPSLTETEALGFLLQFGNLPLR